MAKRRSMVRIEEDLHSVVIRIDLYLEVALAEQMGTGSTFTIDVPA